MATAWFGMKMRNQEVRRSANRAPDAASAADINDHTTHSTIGLSLAFCRSTARGFLISRTEFSTVKINMEDDPLANVKIPLPQFLKLFTDNKMSPTKAMAVASKM